MQSAQSQERVRPRGCLHEEKRQVSGTKEALWRSSARPCRAAAVTHVCFEIQPQQEWQGYQQGYGIQRQHSPGAGDSQMPEPVKEPRAHRVPSMGLWREIKGSWSQGSIDFDRLHD